MKIKLYCNESRHLVFYIILIFIQTNFLIMVQSFFTNRIFFAILLVIYFINFIIDLLIRRASVQAEKPRIITDIYLIVNNNERLMIIVNE